MKKHLVEILGFICNNSNVLSSDSALKVHNILRNMYTNQTDKQINKNGGVCFECRKKIQDSFKRSHVALQVRENILLSRVDEIEKDHRHQVWGSGGVRTPQV